MSPNTMQGFPVDATQAMRMAATESRRLNNGRRIPAVPTMISKLAEETKVWIYNVSPFSFKRELGSAGTYFVPKCEDGEQYATMNPIPGVFTELVIKDETAFELRMEDGAAANGGSSGGRYIAEQVLGVGAHTNPSEALTKWGVFIGSKIGPNANPTKAELEAARAMLAKTAHEYTNEADIAHRTGPKEAEATIQDLHHWAAAFRKLDAREHPWMQRDLAGASGRKTCPMDGTVVDAGVILCPTCKFIFDEQKYNEFKSRMAK